MGGHCSICHTQLGLYLLALPFYGIWEVVLDIQGTLSFFALLEIIEPSDSGLLFSLSA